MKNKYYVFDIDYLRLPCKVLAEEGAIIVCRDTLKRLGDDTYQVLEVIMSTMPPGLHGLFCRKDDAIFYASKLCEREYGKYEFCKDQNCPELKPYLENAFRCARGDCIYSAAQFHRWLDENGFAIVKKVTQNES